LQGTLNWGEVLVRSTPVLKKVRKNTRYPEHQLGGPKTAYQQKTNQEPERGKEQQKRKAQETRHVVKPKRKQGKKKWGGRPLPKSLKAEKTQTLKRLPADKREKCKVKIP